MTSQVADQLENKNPELWDGVEAFLAARGSRSDQSVHEASRELAMFPSGGVQQVTMATELQP